MEFASLFDFKEVEEEPEPKPEPRLGIGINAIRKREIYEKYIRPVECGLFFGVTNIQRSFKVCTCKHEFSGFELVPRKCNFQVLKVGSKRDRTQNAAVVGFDEKKEQDSDSELEAENYGFDEDEDEDEDEYEDEDDNEEFDYESASAFAVDSEENIRYRQDNFMQAYESNCFIRGKSYNVAYETEEFTIQLHKMKKCESETCRFRFMFNKRFFELFRKQVGIEDVWYEYVNSNEYMEQYGNESLKSFIVSYCETMRDKFQLYMKVDDKNTNRKYTFTFQLLRPIVSLEPFYSASLRDSRRGLYSRLVNLKELLFMSDYEPLKIFSDSELKELMCYSNVGHLLHSENWGRRSLQYNPPELINEDELSLVTGTGTSTSTSTNNITDRQMRRISWMSEIENTDLFEINQDDGSFESSVLCRRFDEYNYKKEEKEKKEKEKEKEKNERRGGMIFDKVGFGKTRTVLEHISRTKSSDQTKTTLIIAPVTLIAQWKMEVEKWTPDLSVCVYHGTSRPKCDADLRAKKADIVLTTMDTLVSEFKSKLNGWKCGGRYNYVLINESNEEFRSTRKSLDELRSKGVMSGFTDTTMLIIDIRGQIMLYLGTFGNAHVFFALQRFMVANKISYSVFESKHLQTFRYNKDFDEAFAYMLRNFSTKKLFEYYIKYKNTDSPTDSRLHCFSTYSKFPLMTVNTSVVKTYKIDTYPIVECDVDFRRYLKLENFFSDRFSFESLICPECNNPCESEETFENNKRLNIPFICNYNFERIVVDEAHTISAQWKYLNKFNRKFSWILTATPNLTNGDFKSYLEFCNIRILPDFDKSMQLLTNISNNVYAPKVYVFEQGNNNNNNNNNNELIVDSSAFSHFSYTTSENLNRNFYPKFYRMFTGDVVDTRVNLNRVVMPFDTDELRESQIISELKLTSNRRLARLLYIRHINDHSKNVHGTWDPYEYLQSISNNQQIHSLSSSSSSSSSSSFSSSSSSSSFSSRNLGVIESSACYNFGDGCPICLSDFNSPIALFCKHVFCRECAGGIPPTFRKCPICRSTESSFYSTVRALDEQAKKEEEEEKEKEMEKEKEKKEKIDDWHLTSENPRVEFLLKMVSSSEDSIVIYCSIQSNIQMIKELLDLNNVSNTMILGNMSIQKREQNIQKFMNKECRVIMFTPQIAAAGINLTAANKLIFWDYCWNYTTMKQAIGRLVRRGQTSPVVDIYFLEHANSIESIGNDFLFKCDRKEKNAQLPNDDPFHTLQSCTDPVRYIQCLSDYS